MADERWYEQLESTIYTLVCHRMKKALTGKTSKTIKFTSVGENDAQPYFPTCYIHELQPVETGQDIVGTSINAVIETMECIVYCRDKSECKMILNEAVYQFKQLGFSVTAMPIISTSDNIHNGVARFRRIVGGGDTDLTT
ncbi:MAG: hypothetical protein IJ680_05835 [Paludibacteraceae bacterium]|nr:hypothetical protein [Paludibacteraceae bacterium]